MIKQYQKCYILYVNLTTDYISFKIENGKFLGELKENKINNKEYYVVEHNNDSVNYVQLCDIFKTEKLAMEGLIKILNNKIK